MDGKTKIAKPDLEQVLVVAQRCFATAFGPQTRHEVGKSLLCTGTNKSYKTQHSKEKEQTELPCKLLQQSTALLLTRRWWFRGRGRAGCSSPTAVQLEVLERGAICVPGRPRHVMLLHISLQLLEDLLQSLHPVHMPAVRVSELHHDLQ